MKITVKNLQKKLKVHPIRLKRLASKVSPSQGLRRVHIFLYIVDKPTIVKLNLLLFSRRGLTDVISLLENQSIGEIFLCAEKIQENARHYGVSFAEEIFRCTIHGMLHLFGYDDLRSKDRERMWRKQEALLATLKSIT